MDLAQITEAKGADKTISGTKFEAYADTMETSVYDCLVVQILCNRKES